MTELASSLSVTPLQVVECCYISSKTEDKERIITVAADKVKEKSLAATVLQYYSTGKGF